MQLTFGWKKRGEKFNIPGRDKFKNPPMRRKNKIQDLKIDRYVTNLKLYPSSKFDQHVTKMELCKNFKFTKL